MYSGVDCSSITAMLVFVKLWKTGGFCSGKYLNKETQHTQERIEKRKGCFSSPFYTCLQIVGAVFTGGSLAGSLGRSFMSHCTVVCEQVPAEGQRRLCRARWVMARPGLPFFDPSS